MTHMVRIRYLLLTLFFGAFAVLQASAQMKIGNHPTQIQPASILELESNNQALRLTQGDTAKVNTIIGTESSQNGVTPVSAAEGMIMYQNSDSSIYIRLHGYWHKVLAGNGTQLGFWSTIGNITSADSNFLGTKNNMELHIGADSSARIIITPSGLVKIVDSLSALHFSVDTVKINDSLNVANVLLVTKDSAHLNKTLFIQDSAVMRGLRLVTGDTAMLTIDPNGNIHKMSIDSLMKSVKDTLNGLTGTHFNFVMDSLVGDSTHPYIENRASDTTLFFHIPIATQTVQGIVNTSTQTFGGTKSFADSVAIGQTGTPNSTLQINGNVSMADTTTTQNINMATGAGDRFRTIICDVTSASSGTGIGVTLPAAVDGRIYTFKKVGSTSDGQISSPVTITTSSGNIDGDTNTFKIYNNFTSVTLQAQGATGWVIIGH